jgi:hypothetical protein
MDSSPSHSSVAEFSSLLPRQASFEQSSAHQQHIYRSLAGRGQRSVFPEAGLIGEIQIYVIAWCIFQEKFPGGGNCQAATSGFVERRARRVREISSLDTGKVPDLWNLQMQTGCVWR